MLSGYRKGLIVSLCSLLVLVIACLGATVAQETLTPKLSEQLEPRVTAYVENLLAEELESYTGDKVSGVTDQEIALGDNSLGTLGDLLQQFGIDAESEAQSAVSAASAPVLEEASARIAEAIVEKTAGLVVFWAAFVILFLVLHSALLVVNVVDRLPVLHTLNHLGGGLVGLISGAFLLVMAMAVLVGAGLATEDTFQGPCAEFLRQLVGKILQ
jgi:hypothetical protein